MKKDFNFIISKEIFFETGYSKINSFAPAILVKKVTPLEKISLLMQGFQNWHSNKIYFEFRFNFLQTKTQILPDCLLFNH